MKRIINILVLFIIPYCLFSQNISFPKIDRHPGPRSCSEYPVITKVPSYSSEVLNPFQVSLLCQDLSSFDLSDRYNDLIFSVFNSATVWPGSDKMPKEFDPEKIMEMGVNPGLGIRQLHKNGITGKNIGIAIIDQPLLVDHIEYKDRLRLYEEIGIEKDNTFAEMHGPAVASIAVGKTLGVTPGADLYYIACYPGEYTNDGFIYNYKNCALAINRIIEINKQLQQDKKIRVISISLGLNPDEKGYTEIISSINEASESGIVVITANTFVTNNMPFVGLGRDPNKDPDDYRSYEQGILWSPEFYFNYNQFCLKSNLLMLPMDSRTIADFTGFNVYSFGRIGGISWSVPYLAGVYVLACQQKNDITPQQFWNDALKTGDSVEIVKDSKSYMLKKIINPQKLISLYSKTGLQSLNKENITIENMLNPVSLELKFKVNSLAFISLNFELYDISGHLMYKNVKRVSKGNNVISMPIRTLTNGLYLVRVCNSAGITLKSFKIIK